MQPCVSKITNVSQHHGFLRSESLFCVHVNNDPAFDLVRTVDSDPWVWFCLVSALLEMVSSINTLVYWWWHTQWKHSTTHSDNPYFLLKLHSWTNYGSKLSMFAWFRYVLFIYYVCLHKFFQFKEKNLQAFGGIFSQLILSEDWLCLTIAWRMKDMKLILSSCLLLSSSSSCHFTSRNWGTGIFPTLNWCVSRAFT